MIRVFDPYYNACPFCIRGMAGGITADGKCGHEKLLTEFPHLRFNAFERHTEEELQQSARRYAAAQTKGQ